MEDTIQYEQGYFRTKLNSYYCLWRSLHYKQEQSKAKLQGQSRCHVVDKFCQFSNGLVTVK